MNEAIFPVFYAGNIAYYKSLINAESVCFEVFEHFPKQTFRSRLEITGPNGIQKLSIPTIKTGERRLTKDVEISYAENWQKDHWKSFEAAYRRSPYFEFYEHLLQPLYKKKTIKLIDFNLELHSILLNILSIKKEHTLSTDYLESTADFRSTDFTNATADQQHYTQVFSDRHPFHANLSILDAVFNLGPQAASLLK